MAEPGWRFDPFDEELINGYLKPKILGQQLPRNYLLHNAQVYGHGPDSNPWQLFHPNHQSWLRSKKTTQRYMFVFVKLSKLSTSDSSKNSTKKAGCGTWVGNTGGKEIFDHQGNVIGETRYLVFKVNDPDSQALGPGVDFNTLGHYAMHEYRLSGINEALHSADTLVVCKITHDPSKRTALDLKSATKIPNEAQTNQENNICLGGTGCLATETRTSTSNNLIPLDNGVADNIQESGTENSDNVPVNGLWEDFGQAFWLDDLGGGYSSLADVFTDWNPTESIAACLDSHHREETVGNKLAKRKFEASEDSCSTKKICL